MSSSFVQLDQPAATFSISEANHTTPEDILREVSYSRGGAGGGSICDSERASEGAFLLDNLLLDGPIELGHQIKIGICGWQREDADVFVTLPNGDLRVGEAKYWGDAASGASQSLVVFYSRINDPAGIYTFSFPEHKVAPMITVNVVAPTGPRLLLDSQDQIILYNFLPSEKIRLIAYIPDSDYLLTGNHSFAGWQEYQVDSNGQLTINAVNTAETNGVKYIAIGNRSGLADGFAIADEEGLVFGAYLPDDLLVVSQPDLPTKLCKTVLYKDDFSDIHSGWETQWVNPFNGSSNGYRDDTYFFQVEVADAPMWYVLDRKFELNTNTVRVSVDKRQGEGLFGIILGIDGDYSDLTRSKYLLVTLSTFGTFSIEEHVEANHTILAEGHIDPKIADNSHTLSLKRNGTELYFYVDDTEVAQAQTDKLPNGEVGLYIQATGGGTPLEVEFDDFKICS